MAATPAAASDPGVANADGAAAGLGTPSSNTTSSSGKRARRERRGEPGWLNSALVIGTALFAAIALLGIWWNLRAPYVDPVPKPPGGLAVTPFNAGNSLPLASTPSTAANPANEASAALARAQALAAVDAAASGAAAEIAATTNPVPAPLSASAATAALTAAATTLPSSSSAPTSSTTQATTKAAPDEMMQLLSRQGSAAANGGATRPSANADLPAHYDGNDIGPLAAGEAPQHPGSAPVASSPAAATTIAAALAQCERYRWFEVIPKQRCIWAVCNGRWGKDGCPAGTNPGESR
ncbi:hypothetical protein UC34_23775 [Pandoraea vervacti]|uniref:Phage tail protein n=1 Tax=Pandoraea vervacti TaxID=656178 RepID=A0ABN4FTW4_9BURK|nr:hypothetical protein [Pandoraea vervacti]AJP59154.1 hypothetical protein UC34_23775 [Pandoraea vervacti]